LECGVCGFDYWPDLSRDRREHIIRHHEWEHGVRLRRLEEFEEVGEVEGLKAFLVRPTSPLFLRRQAERVSRRSIREPLFEGGYDKPQYYAERPDSPPELHAHAVLLARGAYAVAMLVLIRRHVVERYRWTERPHFELAEGLPDPVRWAIAHVWVLPDLRRRGLASGLVRLAAEGVGETPDSIGWLSPFTKAGRRLMARVTADGFHRAWQWMGLPPLEEVPPPFSGSLKLSRPR
jgi:ribosomal protein S18 acetylase RimI-like enzyme